MTHNADSARAYIQEKRIMQLAQALATSVAYARPDDPVAHMKQILIDLKAARDSSGPVLVCFTEENIKAMFTVLDPFEKGKITRAQMEGALRNFGTEPELIEELLAGQEGPFGFDEFSRLIQEGVRKTILPPK